MTVQLFVILLTILSLVANLVTEAVKKVLGEREYSSNILVAAISAICGWGGGIATYILMGIAFTGPSIVTLILLAPACWLVATVGYDKVIQTIKQITEVAKKRKEEKEEETE